jgi:hypothetical protein
MGSDSFIFSMECGLDRGSQRQNQLPERVTRAGRIIGITFIFQVRSLVKSPR